ncbi:MULTISPECIES: Lrp/AsnC family transcriptional regulator [unclassified Leptolyngbya]|uniref:Lrp/AsnC family transcriptional regulator n=1 Tax=unclassified Leptolyngbya TaxID=2650499 RepID=UPI0016893E0E|nr:MULTISPECIES: Lrp/AsnC family transcriptional regulator [unclassified Leptolyngbya]MBD1914119.1 Lrp/AsnC family transcriptional regulator [Leptolyngbya sp. FACHB-8]MBD2158728.1 Lrp/AsnC family transcriptional regulator [Leptolyngbya sp. FACHB-16]
MSLDSLDYKVVEQLMGQGRMTWSDLAGVLQLSAPAAADRVRRLEERGVIQGYAALVNAPAVGMDLLAYVAVTLERPEHRAEFLMVVQQMPEIQECHHMAGEDDYWLKVRCRHTRHLEQIISDQIKQVRGVLRTRTTIALSTVKETPQIPLPLPES